jgi:outer membrane protein assembly factor BamB
MKKAALIIVFLFGLLNSSLTAQEFGFPVTVTDGINSLELTLGISSNGSTSFVNGMDVFAPPAPPSGSFDARIRIGTEDYFTKYLPNTLTPKSFRIVYAAATGASPITLTWNPADLPGKGEFKIKDPFTGQLFVADMNSLNGSFTPSTSSGAGFLGTALVIEITPVEPENAYQPPVLSNPEGASTGLSVRPSFSWSAVPGATAYQLQISETMGFAQSAIVLDQTVSGTSITLTDSLAFLKEYFWRVRTIAGSEMSNWSVPRNFTTVIERPSIPELTSPDDGQLGVDVPIVLTWSQAARASNYTVSLFSSLSATVPDLMFETQGNQLTLSELDPFKTYYWSVTATNVGGSSVSVRRMFTTNQVPPQLISPLNDAKDLVVLPTLSWQQVVAAETYEYQISKDGNFQESDIVQSGSVSQTQVTLSDSLDFNHRYYWRVRTISLDITSSWSAVRSFTTIIERPGAFARVSPTNGAEGIDVPVSLVWESSERASLYEVRIYGSVDATEPMLKVETENTSLVVDDLLSFTTYYWHVKAINAGGAFDDQARWPFTTRQAPPVLLLPVADATDVLLDNLILTWSNVDQITEFELQISTNTTFTQASLVVSQSVNDTLFIFEDALYSHVYYWRVRSLGNSETSAWTSTRSFVTVAQPPGSFQRTAPVDNAVNVNLPVAFSWSASDRAASYLLELFDSMESSDPLYSVETEGTSVEITELNDFTRYYWTVTARNAGGHFVLDGRSAFTTTLLAPTVQLPVDQTVAVNRYAFFAWSSVVKADSYRLETSSSEAFTTINRVINTPDTTITPFRFNPGETVYWRVQAFAGEISSPYSKIVSFVTGAPSISLPASSVDFGKTSISEPVVKSVIIRNSGTDSLFVTEITAGSEFFTSEQSSISLAPQQEQEIDIRFVSNDPGNYETYIRFFAENGLKDSVFVRAFVGSARLTFSTDALDMGTARVGELKRVPVTLTNVGNDTLTVTSVLSTSNAFASNLRSFTLLPGQEIIDEVAFAPTRTTGSSGQIIYRRSSVSADTLNVFGNIAPIAAELTDQRFTSAGFNRTQRVNLSAAGSVDPDGDILTYKWILTGENDVLLSEERDLSTDLGVGTSKIKLIVEDGQSATDTSSVRIDVLSFSYQMSAAVEAGFSAFGDDDSYQLFIGDVSFTSGIGSTIYRMNRELTPLFTLSVPQALRTAASVSADSSVFITNGPNLNAFSAFGLELWPVKGLAATATVTPTVDFSRSRIYVGVSNRNFIAFNYRTGANSWAFFADAPISASAVITRDEKLIFPTQRGTLYGFDLTRNLSGTNVQPNWQTSFADSIVHAPAIDAFDNIVVGTLQGSILKINFGSAGLVSTRWETKVCDGITASPVIDAEGAIYVVCRAPATELIKVNAQTGDRMWSFKLNGRTSSTPAISDFGIIYVATELGSVYAIDTFTGQQMWTYEHPSAIKTDLLHIYGTTYLGTSDSFVYAFYDGGGTEETAAKSVNETHIATISTPPQWGTFMGNVRRTGFASDNPSIVSIDDSMTNNLPQETKLKQNYPNPFNPTTRIEFDLHINSYVKLDVFNTLGQRVSILYDGELPAGNHSVTFNGSGLSSGVYIYRMTTSEKVYTKTLMLIK